MKKWKKVLIVVLICYICFYLSSVILSSINMEESLVNNISLIMFILPIIIYFTSKPILKKIEKENEEIIKNISKNYKQLKEINDKYKFYTFNIKDRQIKQREYSLKNYDRALAKDIVMYQIENNIDNIRFDIVNAYRNKKLYEEYLKECDNINYVNTEEDIKNTGFNIKKFNKVEKKLLEKEKYKDVYNITVKVIVWYSSPKGQNNYSKNRTLQYEELSQLYMEWKKTNGYKISARFERAVINNDIRYEVLKRDNFRCKICGMSAEDGIKLHVDHIIPVSKGGKSTMNNLQTLCERCNLGKSNK